MPSVRLFICTGMLAFTFLPAYGGVAFAQDASLQHKISEADFTSRLLALNSVNPRQNPQLALATRILSYRLLDKNRRALGRVSDIVLAPSGQIQSIEADVIATGFDSQMNFDAAAFDLNSESNAYSIALSWDQVKKNSSTLKLADVEPAAGNKPLPVTLVSLIGARVQTDQGRQVGLVEDVLVDNPRKMATALLVTFIDNGRKLAIALPYADTQVSRVGSKAMIGISEDQARIVLSYAGQK